MRGEGGDVPLVSLQQFGNLHVLRLNPSTLFEHIFLQVFILLQTTQSQLEQPHKIASTILCNKTPAASMHLYNPLDVMEHHSGFHVGGGASSHQRSTRTLFSKLVQLRRDNW